MPLIPAAPNKNQKEAAGFKKHPQELTAPERCLPYPPCRSGGIDRSDLEGVPASATKTYP